MDTFKTRVPQQKVLIYTTLGQTFDGIRLPEGTTVSRSRLNLSSQSIKYDIQRDHPLYTLDPKLPENSGLYSTGKQTVFLKVLRDAHLWVLNPKNIGQLKAIISSNSSDVWVGPFSVPPKEALEAIRRYFHIQKQAGNTSPHWVVKTEGITASSQSVKRYQRTKSEIELDMYTGRLFM